jgi:hypothetical protein
MKNDYKDYTSEELAMQDSVSYYMQLTDYIMKEPLLLNRHDKLCRLIITIAEDYPDSIAENRGKVLRFPKVIADPMFGEKMELEFEVFVTMFSHNVDYEASTGVKGDDVFFLTLSLWYEICRLRDLLRIDGIKFQRFEKELKAAIELARARKAQEEKLMELPEVPRELPPHFDLKPRPGVSLSNVLQGLKKEGWTDDGVREVDWVYRLTGRLTAEELPSQEPLLFSSLNQCRYIVKHLIFRNSDVPKEAWRKATQVFAAKKGDISRVQRANKMPSGSNRVDDLLG